MSTSVIKTSLKIGLTLSAVTIVLMLVIESVNQWVLTERSISMLELTMDTELTLLVVVIGLLLATRYLLPDILQQAGYHLIRRREDKPDRQKLSMARWLLFGLAWRLAILLPSFEILLLILVWLFFAYWYCQQSGCDNLAVVLRVFIVRIDLHGGQCVAYAFSHGSIRAHAYEKAHRSSRRQSLEYSSVPARETLNLTSPSVKSAG